MEQISEAFARVCELGSALGLEKLNDIDGCWEHDIDDTWSIALNPHGEPTASSTGLMINPFHCMININDGMPAGVVTPYAGMIMHGSEDDFISAVNEAIRGIKQ